MHTLLFLARLPCKKQDATGWRDCELLEMFIAYFVSSFHHMAFLEGNSRASEKNERAT